MRGFSGKWARTYGRTNVCTEANPKVHRLRRETKNRTIPVNQSEEKWEYIIFEEIKARGGSRGKKTS